MTAATYCRLNDGTHQLDGNRAVNHLTGRLGMVLRQPQEVADVTALFRKWLARFDDCITVHPRGPQFVVAPGWYG
jgi:hypothetical protein